MAIKTINGMSKTPKGKPSAKTIGGGGRKMPKRGKRGGR